MLTLKYSVENPAQATFNDNHIGVLKNSNGINYIGHFRATCLNKFHNQLDIFTQVWDFKRSTVVRA